MKFQLLCIPILLLCSCEEHVTQPFYNYDDIRDDLIAWSEVFDYTNDYYVYFYSERCSHCNDIKQEIISFYVKDIVTLYFVCTDIEVTLGPISDLHGINNIDEFYIFGTPFLVEISNSSIVEYYAGSEQIKEFISILDKISS